MGLGFYIPSLESFICVPLIYNMPCLLRDEANFCFVQDPGVLLLEWVHYLKMELLDQTQYHFWLKCAYIDFFDTWNSSHASDTVNSLGDFHALATEVSLEEEIQILGQEYINLENEQRKLERNAESINNE